MNRVFKYSFLFCLQVATSLSAQTRQAVVRPENPIERPLTICSQNLKNYSGSTKSSQLSVQEIALLKRFLSVKCDIIAVQEVIGADEIKATQGLQRLATLLQAQSGRKFDVKAGELNDANQRVGFLVASDKVEITNTVTYRKLLLPKLDDAQKPRLFIRAPLEVQLSTRPDNDGNEKHLSLINFHFKSKSNSIEDPALLQWETYRMEMAEGLRKVVTSRYESAIDSGQPVILIGDRNSHFDTASAKILDGTLMLEDFKGAAGCRISKRGTPLCQADIQKPQQFISLITADPETSKLPGTYRYKNIYSFLDEIAVNVESAGLFRINPAVEGNYDSGIIAEFPEASDHAMVFTKLHW